MDVGRLSRIVKCIVKEFSNTFHSLFFSLGTTLGPPVRAPDFPTAYYRGLVPSSPRLVSKAEFPALSNLRGVDVGLLFTDHEIFSMDYFKMLTFVLFVRNDPKDTYPCPRFSPPLGVYVSYGKIVMSAQMLEVSLLGVGTVLHLERCACSTVK